MPIEIDRTDPLFTIGVASKLVGLSPKQLRLLEHNEILVPARSDHSRRLYTLEQLDRLRYVSYLIVGRKANAGGVRVALELLARLPETDRLEVIEEAESAMHHTSSDATLEPILHEEPPLDPPPDVSDGDDESTP